MTTIVTRAGKGSPLTHTEVDTNFTNLNSAKLETAAIPLGTLGAPSISFLNYSTTGIYSPAGDELGVSMLGSDKIRIKSTGEIIINATASRTILGITPRLQIEGSASSNQCSMSLTGAGAGSTLLPRLYLSKARSSVNAVVLEDDILGMILFNGGDGSSLVNAGFIKAEVDGTPSAGIVPGRLVFATVDTAGGSGERMIIKNNGNVSIDGTTFNVDAVNNRVGIGTTTPNVTGFGGTVATINIATGSNGGLELTKNNVAAGHFTVEAGANNDIRVGAVGGSAALTFQTGGSERGRFDSSGRLLVGTSTGSSTARLMVEGNTSDGLASAIDLQYGGTSPTDGVNIGALRFKDRTSDTFYAAILCNADGATGAADKNGRLVFSTTADGASTPTERMRINNEGILKVSNNSTYGAGNYHQFNLNTGSQWTLGVLGRNASDPYGIRVEYTNAAPNGTVSQFLYCVDTAGVKAEIRSNGGLANYQANNVNLSDINTKKDISPAADTWNCLKEWEIVNYRYKDQPDDADLNLGVIAQQVAESCPEVITVFQEAKEATEEAPAQEERLGVKEQQMYWMAIKALQEAMERIEQLELEMAAVKSQLS